MRVRALNASGGVVCGYASSAGDEIEALHEARRLAYKWNRGERREDLIVDSIMVDESRFPLEAESYLPYAEGISFFDRSGCYE